MEHGAFIVASYGVAAIVITALAAWIALDYRALRRTIAEYEKRGLTRGSGKISS